MYVVLWMIGTFVSTIETEMTKKGVRVRYFRSKKNAELCVKEVTDRLPTLSGVVIKIS